MSTHCPYLGLVDNPEQVVLVAHPHHRCHVTREPERIGSAYQLATCLGSGYRHCPRLAARAPAAAHAPRPAPRTPAPAARAPAAPYTELRPLGPAKSQPAPRARQKQLKPFELLIAGLLLSMVAAALGLGYAVFYRLSVGPGMEVAAVALPVVPPPLTLVPTYTATAALTSTPAPTPPPATLVSLPTSPGPPPPATGEPEWRPPATSPPTRLVIAKIQIDIPIRPVGPKEVRQGNTTRLVWGDVANAGGFHNTSAYPGNKGNTVINGHRDMAGSVFLHLDRVAVGDEIVVYVGDTEYPYRVSEILIVPETYATAAQRAENRTIIGPFVEERLTLVTCTPVGLATHRLVVIARPPETVGPDMPAAGDEQ